ncbi:hypothetical protein HWN40_05950 [Methanolobus zinderi]|jgi:molybdopterin/thiamine biosynthesis adenylyltransferase|uniref:Uncharacterized protein n=1 Tax=Methanolobus zinderi TaxID=536044 RepID=A0A7D5EGE0_9EURY|nr:hypothetical protein [Methanolobus zinderi]KXS41651.1 MAG: hypothetical protein AWU59_1997 [Methanolobus sp. T82-4]QLC49820.1 hypothetical protein HWN40_05950 [Methanolobus zinderi]
MAQDGVDLSSFMAKVVIVLVLVFVAIWILAKIAVTLGIILIVGAFLGFVFSLMLQNEDAMMYSIGAGFLGLVLLIGGTTCLSFFDNNPVGQNYSCAVNSVFTWADRTFSEKIDICLMSNLPCTFLK